MLFKDVLLRTRRALLLYNVFGDSALLVLNGTLMNSVSALLALSRRYVLEHHEAVMPSSHLACDGSVGPVSCPYPPFRAASAEAGGGCEIFVWIHGLRGLYDLVQREVLQIWKNRKTVARRRVVGGIAQSPHGHRAKADPRTGSVRFPCGGCGDWTATALTLHDCRTLSAQSLYGFTSCCPQGPVEEISWCP